MAITPQTDGQAMNLAMGHDDLASAKKVIEDYAGTTCVPGFFTANEYERWDMKTYGYRISRLREYLSMLRH